MVPRLNRLPFRDARFLLLASCFLLSFFPKACAQPGGNQSSNKAKQPNQAGKASTNTKKPSNDQIDPSNKFIMLKSPVELPDVPTYTGRATFVSGWQYPDDPHAHRTGLVYLVHEDEAEVLQWYQNSLTSFQWKVDKLRPETHQVSATKGKNSFTVSASPYKGPGFRTEIRLGYRVGR